MDVVWWTLVVLFLLLGIAGSLLPFLPGTTLVFAAAVLHKLTLSPMDGVSWWVIGVLGVLLLLSYILDFVSGAVGAKWFGASRWGAIGGILGATIGIFFGLPGIFIGPLAGALLGELLGGKGLLPAGQSGLGTVIGTTAGIISKFVISLVMTLIFVAALILS